MNSRYQINAAAYNFVPNGAFLLVSTIRKINTMKRIFTLIAAVALLSSFNFTGGIDDIIAGLKAGNASQIAKYFDNTVEIALPDKSNSYSKGQGEMILKDFFNSSPVRSFDVLHKGENSGSQYCIGTLVTAAGSFRTTVFMKQKGDRQMVQEIRFESK